MFVENKISSEKRKLAIEKGLPKAINGMEATDFGRGRYFQKLPHADKEVLLNSRKKMLVIREPLQSKDFNDRMLYMLYKNHESEIRDLLSLRHPDERRPVPWSGPHLISGVVHSENDFKLEQIVGLGNTK